MKIICYQIEKSVPWLHCMILIKKMLLKWRPRLKVNFLQNGFCQLLFYSFDDICENIF